MEIALRPMRPARWRTASAGSEWWAELAGVADRAQQVDDAAWRERLLALAAAWQRHRTRAARRRGRDRAALRVADVRGRFEAVD